MMSRIDPIRRTHLIGRAAKPEAEAPDKAPEAEVVRLPVPLDRVSRVLPRGEHGEGQAAFDAQLLGQQGQKRGLRAGPELIDNAKILYNQTEWSGSRDRRAPKGAKARAQV